MRTIDAGGLILLRSWVNANTGLRASEYRDTFLARRLTPRLSATGATDVRRYIQLLEEDPSERRTFVSKLFVPTTEFFRNPEVFETLGKVIGENFSRRQTLRVMSAPCSTGEEPVSLFILLNELEYECRIIAVDRSLKALKKMMLGSWSLKKVEKVDKELRERYFRVVGNRAELRVHPAGRICPVCGDLTRGFPGRGFDLILMRNLLIYLTASAQARLIEKAAEALTPGGLLVLGAVETPPSGAHNLQPVNPEVRIYRAGGEK